MSSLTIATFHKKKSLGLLLPIREKVGNVIFCLDFSDYYLQFDMDGN